MSSTVRVQRWFRSPPDLAATAGELSRHAREFGFTFVGDDDDLKQECASLPPVPPLIPLGPAAAAAAGRLKTARGGSTGSDIDCDDSGRSSAELPPARTYGGVIMVNSGDPGGEGVGASVSEDEDKLLRLFGGGDSDSVSAEEEDEGECGVRVGESDCAVLLDPLPSAMLRSLNSGGRVSALRARESSGGSGPDSSEAREGLQSLDSSDAPREERHEQRRSPRALRQDSETASEVTAAVTSPRPPPLPIDSSDAAEATSRDESEAGAVPKKTRHRKSESPRKAVRRRRERRSSSSGASKKHRKRSTSTCSTTSSTCSNSSSRHHHHKHHHKHHKHRRRSPAPSTTEDPPPTPRVNPIFVWIKQDNTRIVEVLCEDYDKRNRIRLTKTAHGWRAMPRTERLACGAVADPLRPAHLPRPSTPPPAPLVTAVSATSTTDGHGEALAADERCDEQPTDRSTVDQNTSLVHNAHPDCPSSKEGIVNVNETKDEDMEEVEELDEIEEIERVSPVKEVIDIDDDETERYEGDNDVNGLQVGNMADNEVDGNDEVGDEHITSDHIDDDHVDSEHIDNDLVDCENIDELVDSGHVSEQGDVDPVSDPGDVEQVNQHGDDELCIEDDVEHVTPQRESEHANDRVEHGSDNEHVDDDEDHVDECFEEGHHEDAVSGNEHEMIDEAEKDEKCLVPEELTDNEVSSFHETLEDPFIEEHHEVQKDEDNIVEKEEADSLEVDEHEIDDHESPECESLVMETEDEKYSSFVDSGCIEEPEEATLETDACDNVLEDEEVLQEEDDEDTAPTDLSLPKKRAADQDIPVNCKNIPHNISTVIPPVVPSPQPRTSPPSYPPVTPAHQSKPLHTSKFLESLLSSPRKCHEILRRPSPESDKGPAPLDLGVSPANRGAGSPTVSCSDESRKMSRPAKEPAEGEPKAKCLKVEDITLKNLLSRQPDAAQHAAELDLSLASKKDDLGESGRKSRLLELLTSEPSPLSVSPSPSLDASSQLKKVLSDPELIVPDPLLVPRNRLQELISNPGREIPRLLTCRPELRLPDALAYPSLVQDPDLLVISLTHLQSLLQKSEKEKSIKEAEHTGYSNLGNILDWQMYQQQFSAKEFAKELDSQIKVQQRHHEQQRQHHLQQQQSQHEMDAATAAALNQMLWLPYLTQLEAAATACGNPQDFLNILNTVFPPTYSQSEQSIPPPPPSHLYGSLSPSMFNLHPNDFKNQMEFQNALMLWHSAMTQAAGANALNNNNNTSTSNNNHRSTKTSSNNVSKNVTPVNGRYASQNSRKYNSTSSARTSPITPNSFHSPPPPPSPQLRTSSNHTSTSASSATYLAAANSNTSALSSTNSVNSANMGYPLQSQLHQQYNIQRIRQSNAVAAPKSSKVDSLLETKVNGGRSVSCKSLLNLLSGPQSFQESVSMQQSHQHPMVNPSSTLSRQQQQHSHLLAALGKPSVNGMLTQNSTSVSKSSHHPPSPLDLSGATKKVSMPKLKVKEHLIDPAHTPKLLKADPSPEVTTSHAPLWHPLFGSQKTSLNSPWSWTTVTVNGE